MKIRGGSAALAARLHSPRTTVRWRLTLLYGALFLLSGVVLLAVTYTLVAHASVTNAPFTGKVVAVRAAPGQVLQTGVRADFQFARPPRGLPPVLKRLVRSSAGRAAVSFVGSNQRISDLHQLIIESAIALAIMALLSTALGWVVAGRVLRPLRTMTATAQEISEANLNRRLAMPGPPDELRRLSDTIDGLLERLEGAFDAQRRFVANASHELRTPLTAARAMLEMVISDPHATVQAFRDTCAQVLEEGEQQEQLIDALLTLAQGQRGPDHREVLDLAVITGNALEAHEPEATMLGVQIDATLEHAPVSGERRLVERLVSNLVENALRHNVPDGRVELVVGSRGDRTTFAIANTGTPVPPEEIERLLQPFQRLAPERLSNREGLGLGLSIVAAIAAAHDATLDVRPGEAGGLAIEVCFPHPPDDQEHVGSDLEPRRASSPEVAHT